MSKCNFCNEKMGKKIFDSHLSKCILDNCANKSGYLIEFTSHSHVTNKVYKLYLIFGLECNFSDIVSILKKIWCNDTLIDSILNTYEKNKEPLILNNKDDVNNLIMKMLKSQGFADIMPKNINVMDKISKHIKTKKFAVQTSKNSEMKFQFEFSFIIDNEDENNKIYFSILKKLPGKEKNNNIELIYQNNEFNLKCDDCKKKASYVKNYYFFCDDCKNNSNLNSSDLLPVINTPFVGLKLFNNAK